MPLLVVGTGERESVVAVAVAVAQMLIREGSKETSFSYVIEMRGQNNTCPSSFRFLKKT